MTSPNYPLVLSHQAQALYKDILSVTLSMWGEQQYDRYTALLDNAFLGLQDNLSPGQRSRQLPARYRSLHVGRPLIVYRFTEGMVYVVRFLHDRMDLHQRIEESGESLEDDD